MSLRDKILTLKKEVKAIAGDIKNLHFQECGLHLTLLKGHQTAALNKK
jgi:hypothetical protein